MAGCPVAIHSWPTSAEHHVPGHDLAAHQYRYRSVFRSERSTDPKGTVEEIWNRDLLDEKQEMQGLDLHWFISEG